MCSYFSPYPFISFLFIIIFFHDFPISFGEDDYRFLNCSRGVFECGDVKDIGYPFWGNGRAQYCGHPDFALKCEEDDEIQMVIQGQNYLVLNISENNHTLRMRTMNPINNNCPARLANISLPNNLFNYSAPFNQNITLFYDCPSSISIPQLIGNTIPCLTNGTHTSYYSFDYPNIRLPGDVWSCGTVVKVPILQAIVTTYTELLQSMEDGFGVTYVVVANNSECIRCENSGGQCGYDRGMQPTCFCFDGQYQGNCPNSRPNNSRSDNRGSKKTTKILIGVGTGIGGVLLTCIIFILYKRHKRNKLASSSALISRDISRDLSSKPDLEKGSTYFQTPIFTYKELDEATNHFDSSKELGDGGFGTVYHGKLRDGRVVAVKRLFEHNYKRVDQFLNEIQILSRLRHQNLVSLYGCTNRHSRELLLVYEYVPNGTVADHLHGDRAKDGLLTWPVRMTIAIESADALAYLHASDIIHRDVKTNNILLDTAFHVKVADFGLSRLFPTDVTHVSTAPQGTPGYVDPEYYQCYQLNDRSDVYSFGVVLIELISSKPAVDIGRHRHEINLANMAINKIHNRALHELVDPSLGFNSDFAVRNMITLVAELAFRCLQQEKEMRPCMVEVLEILRGIGSEEYKKKTTEEMDISADARLLKNSLPLSPDSVTDKWVSKSTTPNTSG